jgi:PX domain
MDSKNWDSPKILLDPEDIEKEGFKEEEEEKKKTDSVPESVYPKISSDNIYSTKEDENQDSSDSESLEEELEKPNLGLSRKLTITERLSTLTEYGIEISITDPIIVSSALRKHVLYKVSGTDSVGGFQVQRRYKEFMSLRKVLLSEWPGCCILQIPPKQVIVKSK